MIGAKAEFLRQVERALDLARVARVHDDGNLLGEHRLQRLERRIRFRAPHAARVLRVRRLFGAVVLRVEQLLAQRGEDAEERIRIPAAARRCEADVLGDRGLHDHRLRR